MILFILFLLCSLIAGTWLTYLVKIRLIFAERLLYGFVIGLAVLIQFIYHFTINSGIPTARIVMIVTASVVAALLCGYGLYRKRTVITDEIRETKHLLQKGNLIPFLLIFLFWGIIFVLIFQKNLYFTPEGSLRTNSPVDMPVHLAFITSFVWGDNFPPESPIYAGHPLVYPILSDYFTAFLIRTGMGLSLSIMMPSVVMSLVIALLIWLFTWHLTENKLAAHLSTFLLFFSGGFGFWKLFEKDLPAENYNFLKIFTSSSTLYTDLADYNFQWFNFITGYIIPQRSVLFGIPLGLITIIFIWLGLKEKSRENFIFAGIAAGLLPLFHYHAFLSVAIITAILSLVFLRRQKEYFINWAFFVGIVMLLALPQVLPLIPKVTGNERSVFKLTIGFVAKDHNYVWFWIKNTGFLMFLAFEAILSKKVNKDLKMFYIPFLFLFISSNLIAYASWIGDNAKILLFWYMGTIPLATVILARLFINFRIAAAVIFLTLILSGALDVTKEAFTYSRTQQTWSQDDVSFANYVIKNTSPDARFFIAPVHYHILFLTGRTALMGNPMNVHSHSIKIGRREQDIKEIFNSEHSEVKKIILQLHNLDYAIIGTTERNMMKSPEQEKFFDNNYKLVHKTEKYKLFKLK